MVRYLDVKIVGQRGRGMDSFGAKGRLQVGEAGYEIYRLSTVEGGGSRQSSLYIVATAPRA